MACGEYTTPRFAANSGAGLISTANAKRDGTGAIVTILSGDQGTQGTNIDTITIKAIGTTTQGTVRLFLSNGTAFFLLQEIQIPAVVPSAVIPAFSITLPVDIDMPPAWMLGAATENAESFNVIARGNDWDYCNCPTV